MQSNTITDIAHQKNVEVGVFSRRKTTTVTLRPSIKSEPTVDLCTKKRGTT